MKQATIAVPVTKNQVMEALRDMTINDPNFNPDPWSIWDAECLEAAANLIRREIQDRQKAKPARTPAVSA